MKNTIAGAVVAALVALIGLPVQAGSQLLVSVAIEPGACKDFEHPSEIVLSNGFWAKAGSDVTAAITSSELPAAEGLLGTIHVVKHCDQNPPRIGLVEGLNYSGSLDVQNGAIDSSVLVQAGTNVRLPNPVQFYAITSIYIEEEGNNPCRIALFGRIVDPRFRTKTDRRLGEFALDTCKVKILGGYIDANLVGFDGPDNRFIRGLRVCMGGKDPIPPFGAGFDNNEIKGLRVRPAAVSENGAVETRDDVKEWKEPNCPEKETWDSKEGWASWNMCPNDEIVTAVQVFTRWKEFVGLAVACKNVRSLPMPQVLVKDEDGF